MRCFRLFFLLAIAAVGATNAFAITIPTVPVGNAGNANDTHGAGYGGVAYDYRIGTTEVTIGQYSAFLNAVAATDTYALFNTSMATNLNTAGISRTGASGSYAYSVIGSANKPVTFVSWGDAARFSNWLHNGQPTGAQDASTTEDGAYTLNGATSNAALNAVSRNSGAQWFIPSENEWYKGAYHKNDGATGNYWDYPTSTDSVPYSDQPPGSDAPTQSNTANFSFDDGFANGYNDGYAVTGSNTYSLTQNYLTDAGAYTLSTSPYGTYDQGGNVWEWNEALISGPFRGLRGGSWFNLALNLQSSFRVGDSPTFEGNGIGFRVATVPEPSTAVLASLGLAFGLLCFWRKRRAAGLIIPIATLGICLDGSISAQAVTIPTVHVGNPGNAGEVQSQGTFGGVAYDYRIGTTEVTNAQYVAFLNAKAATDPLALYNTNMGSNLRGGITQSGVSGSYTYATKTDMGDKPVNFVSWYDSIRFANWLHNGQGAGDTETGAYTLLGGTPTPSNGLSITRNSGSTWFLPSEDEWYKSAYYQPVAQGGDADNYWLYPTGSNSAPTIATANAVGDISNPGANVANYNSGADWNAQDGNVTTVGSAGPLSDSFYGTADQGGNVMEWNEALISVSFRGLRGGTFGSAINVQSSLWVDGFFPAFDNDRIGFRVATVPEPSTLALAGLAVAALLIGRRRIGYTRFKGEPMRPTGACKARPSHADAI